MGIRLNRSPPQIYFKKKKTGGIQFNSTLALTHLDEKLVQRVLAEYKIHNADVLVKEDCTVDDFIDVIEVCTAGWDVCSVQQPSAFGNLALNKCRSQFHICTTLLAERSFAAQSAPQTSYPSVHAK